ncbi:Hypothetical predicted protein [Pelobates cultripes]|uniref:Uncharacterized protein n=1 Tax=Pelobates cultripes TaxID=61616 RepID=A0AAD1TIS7_PELCU|nr:Hypothetical predicted protein [Pelobates cultripes]
MSKFEMERERKHPKNWSFNYGVKDQPREQFNVRDSSRQIHQHLAKKKDVLCKIKWMDRRGRTIPKTVSPNVEERWEEGKRRERCRMLTMPDRCPKMTRSLGDPNSVEGIAPRMVIGMRLKVAEENLAKLRSMKAQ